MKTKLFVAIILLAALIFCLTSCSNNTHIGIEKPLEEGVDSEISFGVDLPPPPTPIETDGPKPPPDIDPGASPGDD